MEIYYQGKEITQFVETRKCIARDSSGRCDSLDIEFENAGVWYGWGPEEDDQIIVSHGAYSTGVMYLNTALPENGRYRILATALPCKARKKEYKSYCGKTIAEIMRTCGMVTGMDFAIYGIDGNTVIPYIEQENESAAGFLCRMLKYEGAKLKCVNGKYAAIGITYAQGLNPGQTLYITPQQRGTEYRRGAAKCKRLTVKTPYACATAEDESVPSSHAHMTLSGLPALGDMQAGRWARGMLLDANRQCETMRIQTEFNAGYTAMARIDIEGGTDADGEWLIEEAEHDFINLTSAAKLYRCIRTIQ